ncbi:hypothetical protein [Brumimicrobium sp.]|uniref:hypothetical protein n=1 Tax=Brumimicrobium sp. TaxID=2029867 RepID=UPI003A9345CE
MTSFDTLQSISSRLKELSNQLSTSKLSKDELEEFETLSRKLYERAIILNYKAKEARVYGEGNQKDPHSSASVPTPTPDVKPEVVEDAKSQVEQPTSTTNKEASPGEIQFDFSGEFDDSKVSPLADAKEEQKPLVEEKPAPVDKEETVVEKHEDDTPPIPPETSSNSNGQQSTIFYERFSKAYKQAAGDKLGTSKIDSLKGAIGLNDRLLFIGELFGGDSNVYNAVLDELDQFDNNEVALKKLSEIAAQENWDKDQPAVDEFAHLIIRRYVH